MNVFGFEFEDEDGKVKKERKLKSFTQPEFDDGALTVTSGGVFGTYFNLDHNAKSDIELVNKYREMMLHPEVEVAIDDIVNEAINYDENGEILKLALDRLNADPKIKAVIHQEFQTVLNLLDLRTKAYDLFKKWYVDGRLYFHMVIDDQNRSRGIQELRYVDPRKIKKVVEFEEKLDPETQISNRVVKNQYFVYNNNGFVDIDNNQNMQKTAIQAIKIAVDSIIFADSGITDKTNKMVLSYLHKAIKPLNQLRALEDAAVIYRLSRAPERRIFYVDVGNLPNMKAEQYLRDMQTRHKNKLVYDSATGEIRDDRKFMTMLEDYWIPRREGGKGTQIDTLPGGTNLGEIEDINYFQTKLYKALNVPVSRLEAQVSYTLGRASEINRDEVKFHKFIKRLRMKFTEVIYHALETQLALKGYMNRDEFKAIRPYIEFKFKENNFFTELKELEVMRERLSILRDANDYVGVYFSSNYIKKNILRMSDKEIERIAKEIEKEGADSDAVEDQQQSSFARRY